MRLSVIVPCYNVAPYLPETIRSLRQAYRPGFEFLLVDDGSTDATAELLEQLARSLPGSRVLHLPVNRGLSAARNVGLEASAGAHLTFLDGDDFVAPTHFEELVRRIKRLGCDLLRTDHVQVRGRRRTVHRIPYGPRGVVTGPRAGILPADRMTSVDLPYCWAGIYSRRLLDRGLLHFDEQLRTCEDRPWNWRLHLHAESFAVVGLAGVFYRREVSSSLTQTSGTRQLDFVAAYDQIVAEVLQDPDAELLLPKALRSYAAMVCHHLSRIETAALSGAEPHQDRPRGFTYDAAGAAALRSLCADSLRQLPQPEWQAVVASLNHDRQAALDSLLTAAR